VCRWQGPPRRRNSALYFHNGLLVLSGLPQGLCIPQPGLGLFVSIGQGPRQRPQGLPMRQRKVWLALQVGADSGDQEGHGATWIRV
jgi:hypothetical protein